LKWTKRSASVGRFIDYGNWAGRKKDQIQTVAFGEKGVLLLQILLTNLMSSEMLVHHEFMQTKKHLQTT